MAKKNTKNPQNNKSPLRLGAAWRKLLALPKIVLAIVAFVVVILGYNLVYIPVLKTVERRQYDAAAQEMRELMDMVVTEIGEPEKTETKKACGYSSAKFEKGRLGCGVNVSYFFKINNNDQANELLDKTRKRLLSLNSFSYSESSLSDFTPNELTNYEEERRFDLNMPNDNKVSCIVSLERTNINDTYGKKAAFAVSSICFGNPKTEIYPLEK